jgi:hypothetical protein
VSDDFWFQFMRSLTSSRPRANQRIPKATNAARSDFRRIVKSRGKEVAGDRTASLFLPHLRPKRSVPLMPGTPVGRSSINLETRPHVELCSRQLQKGRGDTAHRDVAQRWHENEAYAAIRRGCRIRYPMSPSDFLIDAMLLLIGVAACLVNSVQG